MGTRRAALLGGLFAAGVAHASPDTDRFYSDTRVLRVGAVHVQVDGRALRQGERILAERLLSAPVTDGARLCAADEAQDGMGRLRCWDGSLQAVTLMEGGRPGRLAMGEGHVAWVASSGGLPHVFVAPSDGSAPPRMLTNVNLAYAPGRAPEGYVPPPLRETLRFDGPTLRWEAQDGAHAVRWR